MTVLVELDGPLAGHLAAALALWRHQLRRDQVPTPAGFDDLLALATRCAQPRPATPSVDDLARLADARPVALMITKAAAAEALSVSPRTVDRLITDGRLAAVKVGTATRVRVGDLERFAGALEATAPLRSCRIGNQIDAREDPE
ncbi:MAG: Helix-turn-helix domain [Gaiellales bacterium]|nr:Helix-turn-helix domain [Gaiellales bacterium]